jgi:2',3'-cyclic-nucleotide 2'-phosphodiesterase (5'-nucleotidase family)
LIRVRFVTSLLLFYLLSCKSGYQIDSVKPAEYVFSDTAVSAVDSAIISFIEPYKSKMEGEMKTVIAESVYPMERGLPEGRLGDFVSDACMAEGIKIYYPSDNKQIDFAFFNHGGLRRPLPSGNITRGDVFELMPFENELVVLTLDGVVVKKIFNFIASKGGAPVSNVRFRIVEKQAIDITIDGQPLDTTKTYKALTSDYLANGGDSFDMLTNAKRETTGLKVRDAIMQYMIGIKNQGKKIEVNIDGRITND